MVSGAGLSLYASEAGREGQHWQWRCSCPPSLRRNSRHEASSQPTDAHHLLSGGQVCVSLEVQVSQGARHIQRPVDAVVAHKTACLQGRQGRVARTGGSALSAQQQRGAVQCN